MSRDRTSEQRRSALAFWEQHAAHYDLVLRLFARPLPRLLELAATAVRGRERVLEVAAGTGMVTLALAHSAREVLATDASPAMLAVLAGRVHAAGLRNVRCERAELPDLPYPDHSFDAAVAANVLHLVPDLDATLAALRRVLRPGAPLLAPTFCYAETRLARALGRGLAAVDFPARRRFTARSLQQALTQAGLLLESVETLPGPLPIGYVAGHFPPG